MKRDDRQEYSLHRFGSISEDRLQQSNRVWAAKRLQCVRANKTVFSGQIVNENSSKAITNKEQTTAKRNNLKPNFDWPTVIGRHSPMCLFV